MMFASWTSSGNETFQRTEIALTVALSSLVLLDIVDQHLEAAIHTAMIQIEPEAADLDGLATAFMLARVDTGVKLMENLVIAGEQRLLKHFRVAAVNCRLDRGGSDDDSGVNRWNCRLFRLLFRALASARFGGRLRARSGQSHRDGEDGSHVSLTHG